MAEVVELKAFVTASPNEADFSSAATKENGKHIRLLKVMLRLNLMKAAISKAKQCALWELTYNL